MGNEKDPLAALGMTKRGNVSSHFFSFRCEPTSAPSGHLLPREGGRMLHPYSKSFSRIVIPKSLSVLWYNMTRRMTRS